MSVTLVGLHCLAVFGDVIYQIISSLTVPKKRLFDMFKAEVLLVKIQYQMISSLSVCSVEKEKINVINCRLCFWLFCCILADLVLVSAGC